jgi:hypothetical protein
MSEENKPRAWTAEEIAEKIVTQFATLAEYWATIPEGGDIGRRCHGVAYSILGALEGRGLDLPGFTLVPAPDPSDKDFCIKQGENYFDPKTEVNDWLQSKYHSTRNKLFVEKENIVSKALSIDDIGKAKPETDSEFGEGLTPAEAAAINETFERRAGRIHQATKRNARLAETIHRNTERWIEQGLAGDRSSAHTLETAVRGAVWHAMDKYDDYAISEVGNDPAEVSACIKNSPSGRYARKINEEIDNDCFASLMRNYELLFT